MAERLTTSPDWGLFLVVQRPGVRLLLLIGLIVGFVGIALLIGGAILASRRSN